MDPDSRQRVGGHLPDPEKRRWVGVGMKESNSTEDKHSLTVQSYK